MDPYIKLWMYFNWIQDHDDKIEFAREHGILIGSFISPDAARAMAKADSPDFAMTDEEFDKQMEMLKDDPASAEKEDKKPRRHRHKKLAKRKDE